MTQHGNGSAGKGIEDTVAAAEKDYTTSVTTAIMNSNNKNCYGHEDNQDKDLHNP